MLWGDIMDCKEMGSRIKKARLSQNLTQEQLAELLDISVSYVSLIERGSRNATVETLLAIADVLHVSVTSLLQDSGDLDRDEEQSNIWNELTKNRTAEEKDMILQTVKTIVTFLDRQKK
ncbi:helix-turn-helix transcriptional regulator [Clostridium sp. ASF356]|jgi:transcriptional regulator with XRE-family HTH domain|nr:helix-turn-helix transcriptional regulator [Clostridium sp. MD294]